MTCPVAFALLFGVTSCSDLTHSTNLIVFVEATPDPSLNERILNTYLLPLYDRMINSESAMKVVIYAISANTEAETPLLNAELRADFRSVSEKSNLAESFRLLKLRFNQVYSNGANYSVDILGTAVHLDTFVAGVDGAAEAIYFSDMIQQEALDSSHPEVARYDFSGQDNSRTLDECRKELEQEFGPHLLHREQFGKLRVQIIPLGLDVMRRETAGSATEIRTVTSAVQPEVIQTFWSKDFFQNFLQVREVSAGTVLDALSKIGL